MAKIINSTIILGIIAFTASLALSHINKITYPEIIKQQKMKQEKALAIVLPGYTIKEAKKVKIDNSEFNYWSGEKTEGDNTLKGYAFIIEKPGYSGPVRTMLGINEKGIILGISILQQTETPGLGARCIEIASKKTFFDVLFGTGSTKEEEPSIPWFQEQFRGLDTGKNINIRKEGDWKPEMRDALLAKNSISAITGATITSKTVTESIKTGITRLKKVINKEVKK